MEPTENLVGGEMRPALQPNEFRLADVAPGQIGLVYVDGERVAVYNVEGTYYATQERCSHTGWPLSDGGELNGEQVTCPLHNWCYNVTTGEVVRGIRSLKLQTYRVSVAGDNGHVEPEATSDNVSEPHT
jgi:nitrite reductase/ring-hydroxylating ferredoxin subunit